ncbi:MAG: hypothetical protein M3O33_23355 [Cyanobacteriota bacterium]|nr:hypothetical protein [Cyanobacteriota bacterium]
MKNAVAEIMKNLGWVRHRYRDNGARIRVWESKPELIVSIVPTCPNLDRQLSENFPRSGNPSEQKLEKFSDQVGTGRDTLIVVE